MRIEETVVNIIFDAGKGETPVSSKEGVCGERYGELPRPSRSGYTFQGWFLDGTQITSDSILEASGDVRLTALWEKKQTGEKKRSVMRAQKITAIVLAVCILFLSVGIVIANRLVSVYYLTDRYLDVNGEEQSDRYTIKRENGVYKLFNRDGKLMEITENGYTSSADEIRYEVYVAEKSGNQYLINTKTGEYETYAIVDYDEGAGETLGGTVKAKRVMMFPRVGQDNTYSIEVTNEHGTYMIYRKTVEDTSATATKKYTTTVKVSKDGKETLAAYDPTLFASICVSCGYTLTRAKLDFTAPEAPLKADGSIDYSAYGLEERYDESGALIYKPTTYTVTKAAYAADGTCSPAMEQFDFDGDGSKETNRTVQYTVMVGDMTVSGDGYYVRLISNYANPNSEGREAVYIVSTSIADTVLEPVESLVTSALIYPMSVSTYVMVYNFRLGAVEKFLNVPEEELEKQIKLEAAFDYVDLEEREGSIYTSTPYVIPANIKLMNGYQFNSDTVSTVLGNLYQMEFIGCRAINPTDEDFKEFLLDENVDFISFDYDPLVASGGSDEKNWVKNTIIVSRLSPDGTYYAYTPLYDMIVEVDRSFFSFLEWEQNTWYNKYFFANNISHVKSMSISTGSQLFQFELDNRFSYAFYDNGDGTGKLIDSTKGTFTQNADGSYTFTVTKTGAKHDVQFIDFSAGRTYRKTYNTTNNTKATKIVYRAESGIEVDIQENTNNLNVYYQGESGKTLLDYTIEDTFINDKNETETDNYTALDNFKRFYSQLLWYCIEGDVTEKELGSDVASYIASHEATVEFRYDIEDMASVMNPENYTENNKQSVIVRFYRYNGLRALLTVEVLDAEGDAGDPTQAQGAFYVNARHLDDLLEYVQMVVDGELVPKAS